VRLSSLFAPVVAAALPLALSSALDAHAQDPVSLRLARTGSAQESREAARTTRASIQRREHPGRPRRATYSVTEGQLLEPVSGAACPPEMASVDNRFCIDRWEGSLVEVLEDGSESPWPPFLAVESGRAMRAVSRPQVYPQGYISGAQAASACAAAGKRLCAPVEWRAACVGPEQKKFGYGSERVAGRCNDEGRSPMMRYYPNFMSPWAAVGMKEMNDPRLNQLEGTLAPTGAHEACTNGYGVYDMVGNLHEWTSDPHGTFQGGYYLDTHRNGDGCMYRTVAHDFVYHDYSTGFRCCEDPE
jgi:formylglycine-generating enzyme